MFELAHCNEMTASWLELLQKYRAIAVIRSSELEFGLSMARAAAKGGIHLIEITWNSDQPAQLIEQLRLELPFCTIGTGTILTSGQLKEAIACGSQFCFTPHVNRELIEIATDNNLPIVPGALSPTEIVTAWQAGASSVKIFPVDAMGGSRYIKNLQGPLGQIPLIPTGGVTLNNAWEFIKAGAIAVGLSSQLFPSSLVAAKDWQGITQLCQQINQLVNV